MKTILLAMCVALAGNAFAVENWYWDFNAAGDCSSPAKAKSWSDVSCWTNASGAHPTTAPSTKNQAAWFCVKEANAGVVYVKLDQDITLDAIKSDMDNGVATMTAANRVVLFGEHQVYLNPSAGGCSCGIIYFCGFKLLSQYVNTIHMCGDVYPDSSLTLNASFIDYRMDRYANAAGEQRVGAGTRNLVSPSYGNYRIYVPASSTTNVMGTWQLTAGSPFAIRLSPDAHVLSAGTTVIAADGALPAGTFVKRIFDDATIELSENATASSGTAGSTLTFAAFTPHVTQYMKTWRRNSNEAIYYGPRLLMTSPDDDARLTIANLGGADAEASRYYSFDTDSGYYSGTIAISNAYWNGFKVFLYNCRLEFDATTNPDKKAGLPNASYIQVIGGKTANITVPEGVNAEFSYVSSLLGTLEKEGLGTLTVATTNHVATYTAAYSSGTVIVKAGTFAFTENSLLPKLVTVKSGATLQVVGEVSGAKVTLEEGATLAGGTLVVDSVADIPSGVRFVEGASVRVRGGSGDVQTSLPDAAVAPNAAFWVDFSNANSYEKDENLRVTLIKDVRGSAAEGYMTAAVKGTTYYPYYEATVSAGGAVGALRIDNVYTDSSKPEDTRDPVWSQPLTNIRAVYMVQYVMASTYSGGQFLGWTGEGNGDFMRPAEQYFYQSLFYELALPDKVKNAKLYHNGILTSYKLGYPYQRAASGPNSRMTPIVTEIHLPADCKADSFAHNSGSPRRNGCQIICECIIYTNELTQTQRLATRAHLMRKWLNCEPYWARGAEEADTISTITTDVAYSVDESETLYAESMTAGALTKYGEGNLYLNDVAAPLGSLAVAGGKVTIHAESLAASAMPTGAYVHLDASMLTTLTTNVSDGVTNVRAWKDCRAEGTISAVMCPSGSAEHPPTLTMNALNGKPVVEFGPWACRTSNQVRDDVSMMFDKACTDGHTIIGLYGTQNGGGQVWGCAPNVGRGYNDGYGILRGGSNHGENVSDPLASNAMSVYANSGSIIVSNAVVAHVNGQQIDAFREGFTGGWDIFSMHSWATRATDGIGSAHYGYYSGGQSIAELLIYPYGLSNVEVAWVEAYLAKKWKGTSTPGFREAALGSLSVAAGATLEVDGDGSLTLNALSGNGTIVGNVALADNAELAIYVAQDGTVSPLTLNGTTADFSKGGSVTLTGYPNALQPGSYAAIIGSAIKASALGNWTISNKPKGLKCRLVARDGTITLRCWDGFTLLIR